MLSFYPHFRAKSRTVCKFLSTERKSNAKEAQIPERESGRAPEELPGRACQTAGLRPYLAYSNSSSYMLTVSPS